MRRLQLFVGGSRLVQHAAQFVGPLECSQQELLALGKIGGKNVVVIHNDNCSIDSFQLGKTISGIIWNGSTIPSPPATPAAQIEAAQQSRQLFVVELHARLATGRHFKDTALKSLVPNAKPVAIPEQDLDPVAVTIDEQKQMPRQRILVEDPFREPHQPVEAELHAGGRRAEKDSQLAKVRHDLGAFQGRSVPAASTTAISAAWPTPSGSRTMPPLGNSISTGDAWSEIGRKVASLTSSDSTRRRSASSSSSAAGTPLFSCCCQR